MLLTSEAAHGVFASSQCSITNLVFSVARFCVETEKGGPTPDPVRFVPERSHAHAPGPIRKRATRVRIARNTRIDVEFIAFL